MSDRPSGTYGSDAPWVPVLWFGIALVMVVATVLNAIGGSPGWAAATAVLCLIYAAGGALYLHTTWRGKFTVWSRLLAEMPADGVRGVVDLGCGRGAVLIAAARRFPASTVTGVDLWRSIDQSGNDPAATTANATTNGVADRIALITADMTALPLADSSADLVVSSLAIHNIKSAEGRAAAVREAWRILRPGGRLVIVDLPKIREYGAVLREAGAAPDGPVDLGWRMWWSGPWMPTKRLSAVKSAG